MLDTERADVASVIVQHGITLQIAGLADGRRTIVWRNLSADAFILFHRDAKGRLLAAAALFCADLNIAPEWARVACLYRRLSDRLQRPYRSIVTAAALDRTKRVIISPGRWLPEPNSSRRRDQP